MKKKFVVLLSILWVSVVILSGCSINKNNADNNVNGSAIQNDTTVAKKIEIPTNAEIVTGDKLAAYFEQQIKQRKEYLSTQKLNISGDMVVIYDPACNLQYCDVDQIINQMMMLWITGNIEKISVENNEETKNFFKNTKLTLPLFYISAKSFEDLKAQNSQLVNVFDQIWYKIENGYVLPLFLWQYGKENICDDNLDNDWDWKVDAADPDCKQVVVLTDSKCEQDNCKYDLIKQWLKSSLFILGYYFTEKDYSKDGKQFYQQLSKRINNLYLPVVIFNDFIMPDIWYSIIKWDLNSLIKYGDIYILNLWAIWDPVKGDYTKKTALDQWQIQSILNDVIVKWDLDKAEIVWLEYSDLECPYCAKQHKSGNIDYILNKYGDKVAFVFKHFPLSFHKYAEKWAIAVECVAKLTNKDSNKVYKYIEDIYNLEELTDDAFVNEAVKLGLNKNEFEKCLSSDEFKQKIYSQMREGQTLFDIKWTPGNVFINIKTGRFEVVPWAYPKEKFEQVIEDLLTQ